MILTKSQRAYAKCRSGRGGNGCGRRLSGALSRLLERVHLAADAEQKIDRKPIAGGGVRVVDELGNDLGPNEVGELVLRIRRGRRFYFNDSDATDRTWQNGWVNTGDLGCLDADGFVYLVDRKKDMIIRGGYNVYSVEVENALYEHPAIAEVAVFGIPHRILGQDVMAVARLEEGASLDLSALHEFLADRLADYKQPHQLIISDVSLPRTALDKVDKVALRSSLGLDLDPHL